MKNIIKFFIALFLGVSLFYFVIKETGVETVSEAVLLFLRAEGLFILGTTLLIVLVGAIRWREILRSEGEDVSLIKTIRYLVKGFTVDFLTPFSLFGGEAVRIFLMKKEVGIEKSVSSTITDKIIDVTAHIFFLTLGTIFFIFHSKVFHKALLIYAVGTILFISFILFVFYKRALRKKSFLEGFFNFLGITKKRFNGDQNGVLNIEKKIFCFFAEKKRDLAKGIVFSFLRHFLLLLRVFLVIYFVVGSLDISNAVITYGFVILSMILPLPAALGGMEAILALTFNAIGISVALGVVVAIVLRTADLFVCAIGIMLFTRLSIKSFYKQFKIFLKSFAE
jgi:glycosyltransferase 2 family protein